MAYQLLLRSPTGEYRVVVDHPIVVGRDPSCDVAVESARVSRRHAEFVPTSLGVTVKDLGSRNGVIVNGTRVEEASVTPADRVLLGDVTVTVSVTGSTSVSMPQPPSVSASGLPPAPPFPAPPLAPPPGMPPSPFQPAPFQPAPPPYAQPAWATPDASMPAPGADKTTMLPKGATPVVVPQSAPAAHAGAAGGRTSLMSRVGIGGRLTMAIVAVSLATFVVTACPMYIAHSDAIQREVIARAATVARSVAVQNGAALASGQTLSIGVQVALAEPGVREALVIGPTGRVLAPVERMGETIQRLEPFGDLTQIQGLQTATRGDEVLALAAVESAGRQLGFVWIRLDPSYAGSGAPFALWLFAALVCGLACAVGVAIAARRVLTTRLAAFATDIDLAAGGQIEAVTETLGMPRLADSVNFIIGRMRMAPPSSPPMMPASGPSMMSAPPPFASAPPPMSAAPAPPAPPPVVEREGRVVLDSAYLVKEATPGAVQLLRLAAGDLVGRHVLEAITDPALVNAIIDGTADLGAQGSATRRIEGGAGAPALDLEAQRLADGSIQITIRRLG